MPTEVNRSGMEEVEGISARVLHVTASFGIQDPEESLGNVPGIGIGALDRATCYTCSAAVTIHVSVVPFESACARNLHCPVLSLVRVPNTLIRVAILRDGDTARPQRRIVGLIAGQVRASEVPLIVSRAHVIVLTRTAVFAAALKPYVQSSWIGESGWIVSYVHVYVRDNPTTLTDPTGLDIWLQGCGKDSSTCQNNYVGTTDDQGNFTRTHLTGDQTNDATLGPSGITVTQDGNTYQGVWDTNKGENGTVEVAGTGALKGYNADVNGNCGGTCVASGSIKSADPNAGNITQALFGVLDTKGSGYVKNAGTDALNFFHPGAVNFRGHSKGDPKGIPSTHIPID